MWDIFKHFLIHVAQIDVKEIGLVDDGKCYAFYKEQLRMLDQGIRDERMHENSLAFVSWYEVNWGEFLVGEGELWPESYNLHDLYDYYHSHK